MTTSLQDPNQPAGAIVETYENGSALRNDGVELQPANENPWYVLATIYGEYSSTVKVGEGPNERTVKNRRVWNYCVYRRLGLEKQGSFGEDYGLDQTEVDAVMGVRKDWTDICKEFGKRYNGPRLEGLIELEDLIEASGSPSFLHLFFSKSVDFCGFIFDNQVSFKCAVFDSDARFTFTVFSNGSNFGGAVFRGNAHFDSAKFSKLALFESAEFTGVAQFDSTRLSRAHFESVQFHGKTSFKKASFRNTSNFSSATFKARTDFTDAKFETHVPEFHATSLYADTIFTLPANPTDNWPALPSSDKDGTMSADAQKRAYNRLRVFMNSAQMIDEEQFFHRQEMRCKRALAKGFFKPLFTVFEFLSNYGNSVSRPLVGLLCVIVIGTVISGCYLIMQHAGNWGTAWGWSFSNVFPFLGVHDIYYGGGFAEKLPWWLKAIGGIQTFVSVILLFLLGLGLRNQFRLR